MLLPQAGAQAANVPRHLPAAKSANIPAGDACETEARPDANGLACTPVATLGAFEHHLRMMIVKEGRNGTV